MENKDILDDFKAKGASASNDTSSQKEKSGGDAISAMRDEISAIRGSNEKRDEAIVALSNELRASAEREKELRSLADRQSARIERLEGDFDKLKNASGLAALGSEGISEEQKKDAVFEKSLEGTFSKGNKYFRTGVK